MNLLEEITRLAPLFRPELTVARVEVSQRQYDELRGIARQQALTAPYTGPDAVMGIPIVVVDAPLDRPVLVYADGRREPA
jgi:hypothetical protein